MSSYQPATRIPLTTAIPEFPWDQLAPAKAKAESHPGGIVNLSIGTPVDDVAPGIQLALANNAAFPGYPQTIGTPELRAAIVDSLARRYEITDLDPSAVLPVIGTKEAIAGLPHFLNVRGTTVVVPEVAYPTYEVGVLMAGAEVLRADSLTQVGPATPSLMFINSPSNPTGKVLGIEHLRKVVSWAQERGVILVSDECYLGLNWSEEPAMSILHPEVCGGNHTNLLAMHSLSKTSNLASYRAGFMVGDPVLTAELTELRKHAGLMMPAPIQYAMTEALKDDEQELAQKARYAHRRAVLWKAFSQAGFRIDESAAGLYLWATRGEDASATVDWLSGLGILVAPGTFYGPSGKQHVRIAMTASDEDVEKVAQRLAEATS